MVQSEDIDNLWLLCADGKVDQVEQYFKEHPTLDVNTQDNNGYSPLHAAASYEHESLVVYLLEQGADIQQVDGDENTVLHYCESVPCAKLMLEKCPKLLDAKNSAGQTVLDVAVEDENQSLIDFYLTQNCEANDVDLAGLTIQTTHTP